KHLQSRGATLRSLAQNGCPPVPGFAHRSRYLAQFDCATQNHKAFQLIRELPRHTIVVTHRAPLYLSSLPFDNGEGGKEWGEAVKFESLQEDHSHVPSLEIAMRQAVQKLLRWGHRVVLVYPLPELG